MLQCKCKKCGEVKDIAEFNKVIGAGPLEPWNVRMCKSCAHAQYLSRYAEEEKRKTLNASSNNWKKNNPEHHAALAREYRTKNKEKTKAQNQLNYAIRTGRIKRQPCETCGTTERVHAHHVSYKPEDWYNVRWFCYICHKLHHTEPDYVNHRQKDESDANQS